MARPKDTRIEHALQQIVRKALSKHEAITVKQARSRAEVELGLEDDFLKNDSKWKGKSKQIIQAAFDESDGELEAPPPSQAPKPEVKQPSGDSGKPREEKAKPQQTSSKKTETPKPKSAPAVKAKTLSTASSESADDGGSSSSGSESTDDSAGKSAKRNLKKPTQPSLKKPNGTPAPINGVKRKASEHSSSEEESASGSEQSDGNEDESGEPDRKKSKTSTAGESGDTLSDNGEHEEPLKPVEHPPPAKGKAQQSGQPMFQAIPPRAYKPPSGYTAVDPLLFTNNTAFTASNLESKQIWHITAPSNVPLSLITEVSMDAVQANRAVLIHNGMDYALNEYQSQGGDDATVLVPGTDGYARVPCNIERTLHLQQKITLPNLSVRQADQLTGSAAAGNVAQAAVSNVRPQPKGLRMRFKPPGFGSGKPGRIGSGSDSVEEDEQPTNGPTFQFPKTLGVHENPVHRGADVSNTSVANDTSASMKPKKKKKRKDEHDAESERSKVNGVVDPIVNGVPAHSSTEKEDKAKRKEEKRLKHERKEEKRKSKEAAK